MCVSFSVSVVQIAQNSVEGSQESDPLWLLDRGK
jgi:hypothetical protein